MAVAKLEGLLRVSAFTVQRHHVVAILIVSLVLQQAYPHSSKAKYALTSLEINPLVFSMTRVACATFINSK